MFRGSKNVYIANETEHKSSQTDNHKWVK